MTNPNPNLAEPALKDLVWSLLPVGDSPDSRLLSDLLLLEIYSRGIIDSRKHPLERWQGLFKEMPRNEGGYLIKKDKWPRVTSFFFQGPIKKPFDPKKLKDGLRPLAWLNEVYQKVLRFETSLTLDDWKKII